LRDHHYPCTNHYLRYPIFLSNITTHYRFPDPEWLLAHAIPVQYGLQHTGDVVVLQGSTVSWSRSLGFSVHSSWNIAHLIDLQFAQAYERYEINANTTPPLQSIVPIKTLTIDIASCLVSLQHASTTDNNASTISASLLARIAEVIQRIADEETAVSKQLLSQGIDSSVEPANATAAYCGVNGCQNELCLHYYRCEKCDGKIRVNTDAATVPQLHVDDTVWCRTGDGHKPVYMCVTCADRHREASQLGSNHTMKALRRQHVTLKQLQQLAVTMQKFADERFSSDNKDSNNSSNSACNASAAIAEHPVASLPLFKLDSEHSINTTIASTAASTSTSIRRHRHHHCNTIVAYDTDAALNGVPTDDALIAQALKCDDSSADMMFQHDWGLNGDINAIATAGDLLDANNSSSNSSSSTDRCNYLALAQQGIQTATVLSKLAARMSKHGVNNSTAGATADDKSTGEAAIAGAAVDATSNCNSSSSSSSSNTGNVDMAAQAAMKAANDSCIAFQKLLAVLGGKPAE
jgi:hypothetical protein